jgi:aspartyl-tRNA(Asn)/glutamyl-tRNA(Gln) amidotransferase subunit C
MVSEKEVEHIAELADVGIDTAELDVFTHQFNEILEYFDMLDQVQGESTIPRDLFNVLREDEVLPSLLQEEVLQNAGAREDGFIKAPRVM